jgi:rubrerythrin
MAIDKEDVEKIAQATADEVLARIGEGHDNKWFRTAPIDEVVSYLINDERDAALNYDDLAIRIGSLSSAGEWAKTNAEVIRRIADQEEEHSSVFMDMYDHLKDLKKTLQKVK